MSLTAHTINAQHLSRLKSEIITVLGTKALIRHRKISDIEWDSTGSKLECLIHLKNPVGLIRLNFPKLLPLPEVLNYLKHNYPELFI